jgi:large subunit ribosomal protein L28
MAKCEFCGKLPMYGNNVPHSLHKTRRRWRANLQKVTINEEGRPRKVYLCVKCLRTRVKARAK